MRPRVKEARPAAVQAVAFGTLLPLAFVSEIFLFGDPLPAVLSAVGWAFRLRRFAVALADTADPTTTGAGFAWDHLGIITVWGLAGLAVARQWFASDPAGETRRDRRSASRQPGVISKVPDATSAVETASPSAARVGGQPRPGDPEPRASQVASPTATRAPT